MGALSIHLALHGVLVLFVSVLSGVTLWRVMLRSGKEHAWHLIHAGGSVRGVLLIALAAVVPYLPLPPVTLTTFVWLMIVSIWSSMFAMLIAAITGDRGLQNAGTTMNRLVYLFYGVHAVTLFPAFFILIYGLISAL
jgi:hypothetical protein